MTNAIVLNNVDHHDLRVIAGHSPAFGDSINQVLALPTEYEALQRHYPILLRKTDDGWRSVALLGLERDENLFLDAAGWQAAYVPAVQQRGPLLIGPSPRPGEGPVILIDLDHPRVSRTEGERLFLPHGGHAPLLEHGVRVLRVLHDGMAISEPMFAAFEQHALMEPLRLQIALDEETHYDVPDCYTIAPRRLAALDGSALGALHQPGFLRLAFLVVASLSNVEQLIARKNRRRGAALEPA